MDLSRLNRHERLLASRLKWMREREDILLRAKSGSELKKLRLEIQQVVDELKSVRTRRSRFLCVVGNDSWNNSDNH